MEVVLWGLIGGFILLYPLSYHVTDEVEGKYIVIWLALNAIFAAAVTTRFYVFG